MSGPAGVMALLLAETLAGGIAFLFLTPLWSEVKRGFFKLTGSILVVLGLAACGSVAGALVPGDAAGRASLRLCIAVTVMTALWVVLLFARRMRVARAAGYATVLLCFWLLGQLALTGDGSFAPDAIRLFAGAAFVGSVLDGLLLGHWYLTDRGLPRTPINRFASVLIGAVAVKAAVVIASGFGPTRGAAVFNPLLTSAGLASWIALGMVAATALIAVLIRLMLRGERASAVQAATGFFYLTVLTAFTAELATLVGYLPPK